MTHAIRVHATGGPEVLTWEEVQVPSPARGEVLLRQTAIGLNFIDVYHRTGLYPAPLPFVPGLEGAGVVEAIGEDVAEFQLGDRVAYANPPLGAYAERRVMPADRLVRIPDSITDRQAAAMMLQGMTAQYLLRRTYPVRAGDTVLIHAAAGGVGLLACQWAKHLGATIIGTVGSEDKAELARRHGCDHAILYKTEDFVAQVREITNGAGVPVVYDSVGRDTFLKSLDCLSPLGMMVSFGQSSGKVEPFDTGLLGAKGSLFLTRPSLMTYTAKRADLVAGAAELFEVVATGAVKVEINQTYPLSEAAKAHRDLEARRTTGSTLLLPS
ncbi:quinone oxidoreductase [Magnetospirillum sp. SS-4]|uniref:quinone oxidoreductase family protein n=1 Tax=Magnetospirillum sp. SS-4 TaxID=2681465 RepID=UPI00138055AF|nr:quinone oxidoreductase [Magnetospirillum sp. SS-4]CAA7621096.1 Quinone oxidoreductase [Magnetospirillum sp. SS-4]